VVAYLPKLVGRVLVLEEKLSNDGRIEWNFLKKN
jgi:hypothetical protein